MSSANDIPVSIPDISDLEQAYVTEALRSTWISSTGPFIDRFEEEFSRICDVRTTISVSNGTVALHLGVMALGLKPGDEVIVPSLTYIATANAVRYAGGVPVFVDVDPDTWCIDPKLVEAAINQRTKGIIAVHLYGHPADMDAICEIARRRGLWVMEDAAEAHLARYKGRPVGGLGDVGMFSFYGNKIITSGEGGALTLNDAALEQRARLLRGQGMDPNRRYYFPVVGYNYRLTNVACAMLCAQLERREAIVSKRKAIVRRYRENLADVAGIGLQPTASWAEPTPWLFCIVVEERNGQSRDELARKLRAAGIDTRPFFFPIHRLPPYLAEHKREHVELPNTDRLSLAGLNLPTFPSLSTQQIDRICDVIRAGT